MDKLELIASGRDADIFAVDEHRVLRRAKDGRSLAAEAEVMEHVRAHGFPTIAVDEVRADGSIVLERLYGRPLLDHLGAKPWQLGRLATMLADLHLQLGEIGAIDSLRDFGDGGNQVIHQDLHPLNVFMTDSGPMVIDWGAARRGRPESDIAMTWVILASSEIPRRRIEHRVMTTARSMFTNSFLRHCGGRERAEPALGAVITDRLTDRHITDIERRYLLEWEQRLSTSGVGGA